MDDKTGERGCVMVRVSEFDNSGVEGMSKEEYAARQAYVIGKCLCAKCPTYVKGDEPVRFAQRKRSLVPYLQGRRVSSRIAGPHPSLDILRQWL